MAHTNGHIPTYSEESQALYLSKLKAECDFYKGLAEQRADELRNIPEAIEQYGYWTCQSEKGEVIRLVKSVTGKAEDME